MFYRREIFFVEAAHVQTTAGLQYRSIMADVIQQDISIDIGKDIIERAALRKAFCSALFYPYIERMVEPAVLKRVTVCPLVDVDSHHTARLFASSQNGKYGRAAPHVEYFPAVQVERQHFAKHEIGGGILGSMMMVCSYPPSG